MKHAREQFLRRKVEPFDPSAVKGVAGALEALEKTGFQGRTLGTAFSIWRRACEDGGVIFFGLAGAMVPAGMRKVLVHLIENRLIDVLVTTGANVFHDIYETLGHTHYQWTPFTDDEELRRHQLDRIYDTLGDDKLYCQMDREISSFAGELEYRPYTTREFFHLFGQRLAKREKSPGVLTSAARHGVAVYCPAPGDSGYGLALAAYQPKEKPFLFNVPGDVREMGEICHWADRTSVVFLGGGTPKNFTQQAWVEAEFLSGKAIERGHRYCIQITQDAPQWGGLSGCTFDESVSWGKIDFQAEKVACYADGTIALPLLAAGLHEVGAAETRKRIPKFVQGRELALEWVERR